MELEATYALRDLESSKRLVLQVEGQRNNLMAQQKHWDDLRRTADRVESLFQQIEKDDSDEVAELKRARDESKIFMGEHAYLKKRYDEQERRIADFTRGQQTAKQTIAQSQQQAANWERRATAAEAELETQSSRVDELEDIHSQLNEELAQLQSRVTDLLEAGQQHDVS
jgi:chromosome segregation ATPase